MTDHSIIKFDSARQALAECKSAIETKQVMDAAEASRVYLQRTQASVEMVNKATEIRLLAEKQMGEFLAESPKQHGSRGVGKSGVVATDSTPTTLAEIGISKDQSARAQKLAALTNEEFQSRIDAVKGKGKLLSTAAVLNPEPEPIQVDETTTVERPKQSLYLPLSKEAVSAGQEAANDSEKLWKLKSSWKQCSKKEKAAFLQWRHCWERDQINAGASATPGRRDSYRLNVGMDVLDIALAQMGRITPDDASYEEAYRGMIEYCEARLAKRKGPDA